MMATPSTRQAIVQAILKRRTTESLQREKKSMKGYVPSYLEGDEKCVVCGDKATGYHYKCITCEGCKGFFRRTVQKSLENSYQCKHSAKCDINKITRNQCQLCRYNKCISVGMATDLVLDEEKRLAKRKLIEQNRELRRHKELSQMMAQCGWRIERPTDEERRLIHDVTQGYFQANDTQNKTMHEIHNTSDVSERFSVALTAAITNVVDFAKRIPLFVNHISTDDQVLILKVCCMEVITLRCVTSFKNVTKRVTLFPTVDVTKEQLQCTRLEPFCDALFALAEHMHSIDLTPVEIALLQAVIVFTADRPGISERVRLDHAQNTVIRAFEHHLNELWPHDPQYCPSLLIKLNEIRVLSANLSDILMSMRMDEPGELGRLFQATNNINSLPVSLLQVPVHHHLTGLELSKLSQLQPVRCLPREIHKTVTRSFSQPQLNGYKSTLTPGTSQVNSSGGWKTSQLNELLDRNHEAALNELAPAQGSPSNSPLRNWIREVKSSYAKDYQEAENQTRFPSLNGLTKHGNNHVVYETFKNCNNKLFQRMSRSLPFSQACPSRNLSLPCTTHERSQSNDAILPSVVRNGAQQAHKLPNENTAPAFGKSAVNNFCLQPFQLPSVTTEPSAGFDAKINLSTSYHEGSSSTRNTLITAGILRMGLPMLLPYVTGANSAVMTSNIGINGVTAHNESHYARQIQPDTEEMSTSLSIPNQTSKKQLTNQNGNEIHDLTLSDNEDNSSPTQAYLTPSKRPISSPTLPQRKLKCVSPSYLPKNGEEEDHGGKPNTSMEGPENVSTKLPSKSQVFIKNGHSRNPSELQAVTNVAVQPRPKSF